MGLIALKKIILSTNVIWAMTQFRYDLIVELKQKYKVFCLADLDDFSEHSVNIINTLDVEFIRVPISRKSINVFKDLRYFFTILKIYFTLKPDVIIHYSIKPNIYGSIAAKVLKIPSFAVITGLGSSFIKNNFLTTIVKFMYSVALKNTHKAIFLNKDDLDFFVDEKIISEKISFLMPGEGVNVDYYKPCPKNPDGKISFLMVARLLKDKGIYEYIDAIKQLGKKEHLQFFLAGMLDEQNPTSITQMELEEWIHQGLIQYLGKTDDIREFFKLCDVVVLPSYREGLSRVLLEANSCGKFIIATNIPGCKELCIDGKNGFLAMAYDSHSLKSAIEKTIELDYEDLNRMGGTGRLLIQENYSSTIINNLFLNLVEKALA